MQRVNVEAEGATNEQTGLTSTGQTDGVAEQKDAGKKTTKGNKSEKAHIRGTDW